MTNIVSVSGGHAVVTIEQDKDAKKPYNIDLSELIPPGDTLKSVTWQSPNGIMLSDPDHNATELVVWFSGGVPREWYTAVATWVTASGATDQFVVRLYIREDAELATDMGSALFPNKFAVVAQLRRDRLMLAAQNHFADVQLDGAYIWEKLRAAEAEVARTLRVKFEPTMFFPQEPTAEQLADLNGMPWELDEGYDYDPAMYTSDRWGMFKTHSSPIIEVKSIRFAYPAQGNNNFDIPADWIQLDRKYGNVRIVPLSTAAIAQLTPLLMQLVAVGRVIPNMVRITYVAGLKNAAADYPDLVDAVKKLAVLKIIEDGFLPQSGSISGDGLSQSMSFDMGKYEDAVDRTLTGGPGVNGGLRTAIHGITMTVM